MQASLRCNMNADFTIIVICADNLRLETSRNLFLEELREGDPVQLEIAESPPRKRFLQGLQLVLLEISPNMVSAIGPG